MAKKAKKEYDIEFVNRKAAYEYHFVDTLEAGIKLAGTEIKSIRKGLVNLKDSYCHFVGTELFARSLYIKEYDHATHFNHEPRRDRKLLLKKTELKKWQRKVKERGYTMVPYRLYVNEKGLAKLEICLCQGKKSYDKRDSIKEKDNKRDLARIKKQYG